MRREDWAFPSLSSRAFSTGNLKRYNMVVCHLTRRNKERNVFPFMGNPFGGKVSRPSQKMELDHNNMPKRATDVLLTLKVI